MLFGGFLLNNESAPQYVEWLQVSNLKTKPKHKTKAKAKQFKNNKKDISFFNHAFEALTANELAGAQYQVSIVF